MFGPGPLRLFYLNAHYRSPLAFQPGKSLEEAREAYARLTVVFDRISEVLDQGGPDPAPSCPRRSERQLSRW